MEVVAWAPEGITYGIVLDTCELGCCIVLAKEEAGGATEAGKPFFAEWGAVSARVAAGGPGRTEARDADSNPDAEPDPNVEITPMPPLPDGGSARTRRNLLHMIRCELRDLSDPALAIVCMIVNGLGPMATTGCDVDTAEAIRRALGTRARPVGAGEATTVAVQSDAQAHDGPPAFARVREGNVEVTPGMRVCFTAPGELQASNGTVIEAASFGCLVRPDKPLEGQEPDEAIALTWDRVAAYAVGPKIGPG